MKNNYLTIALAATLALGAFDAQAKSSKRGVSENQFRYLQQTEFLEPGVTWYYNWAALPPNGMKNELVDYDGMEFVPMCWNANYKNAIADLKAYCAKHPEVKYILGYNEPNFKAQANMTPAQAAEDWPNVQALARELGLEIVAPALNYSPDAPYNQPTKWMDEFVALVGLDAFDYVALHNYGGLGVMKDLCSTFHQKYGKPVWVTEFCYWPGEAGGVSQETQISTMIETVQWLEQTDYIYRYAWFKAIGKYDASTGPNYGLEDLSYNGTTPNITYSDQGYVYVYMPDFDKSVYQPVNKTISSTDFVDQKGSILGKSNLPEAPSPIEITQFPAGAWTDYQFDIPADGNYTFRISASGKGEPERFDPVIAIHAVNADGTDGAKLAGAKLTLSNDDAVYRDYDFAVDLKAGRQTIRMKYDFNFPSGIRIATVGVFSQSGVEDIVADGGAAIVDVYNLQGVKVREAVSASDAVDGLPAGIYLVGSQKVVVR